MKQLGVALIAAGGMIAVAAGLSRPLQGAQPSAQQGKIPLVYGVTVDGIIHPVAADYIAGAIRRADGAGAALLVITLRTPGGLVDSTRAINSTIIAARTPVAVLVAPSGSRAASAGFLITIAADVAAMAPGTHIGAAHPVTGTGEKVDETMGKKMASDVAAYARSLASKRGRNVALVEQAVTESRSFTEDEALKATPPLIDLIATDVNDLLKKLDGRQIRRFDGRVETLRTAGAYVETIDMSWGQRILSAIAHPQVAYLLFSLGTLGLTIELWNPGAILPGVVGGICLLLAFFAFSILPVNYAALLLIVFGIVLLILEVKVTSYGLLGVGGVLSLLFGSLMLMDSPVPEMQLGLRFVLPIVLAMSGILFFLVKLAVDAQQAPAVTGESGMLSARGRALTPVGPHRGGRVLVHGEIWNAVADEPIGEGEEVRVDAVDGLTLHVRRLRPRAPA
jgi:membrane-bound serine protease (ClpP class)